MQHAARALGLAGAAYPRYDDRLRHSSACRAAEGLLGDGKDVRRKGAPRVEHLRFRQHRRHTCLRVLRQRTAWVEHEEHLPRPSVDLAGRVPLPQVFDHGGVVEDRQVTVVPDSRVEAATV